MNILIVGGSGTFGRAFAKFALDQGASRVCIYSRGEHVQAAMRQELGDDSRLRWFIGDVRDQERLVMAMQGIDCVIHAAALKRIEVGHYAPDEMIKTNIGGALNVTAAAFRAKVNAVVALSTDKAWRGGISPYGQSKALAESIFLNANHMHGEHGPKYSIVRYGNIWRSQGSVVPKWEAMIAAGNREVPVTDPDCTRFFMLASEAVSLVWHSLSEPPGLIIPDWLPAYRLGDLAEAMGVSMRVTGLPTWERKHEGMRDGLTSDIARRLTVEELRRYLTEKT